MRKTDMKETLKQFTEKPLVEACAALLEKLGVKYTPIVLNIPFDQYFEQNDFKFQYVEEAQKSILHIWHIGFIDDASLQGTSCTPSEIEQKYESMSIFACDIKADAPFPRGLAVNLTRAFNRVSSRRVNYEYDMPVIVLFRQDNKLPGDNHKVELSIATCERTNRRKGDGDKIGKVTILRNINCDKLHPGHRQILEKIANEVKGSKTFLELYQKWLKSFSIDILGDDFFDGYKQCYEDIIEFITGKRMVKESGKWVERTKKEPNEAIMKEFSSFAEPEKAVRDYVKKLMGRLVFIQFLQKKGWMGVPAGERWEGGDQDYLQNLYKTTKNKDSIVDDVLTPLFKDLNTKRDGDLITNLTADNRYKVPYLNGGLFDQDESDVPTFPLPGMYIEQLFDFFAQYNFTIDENAPDDVEVGVDPEMLGRIFENLLEDNKDKGAYYTPKEVVRYMCRESLISFLQNDFPREYREKIREFVLTYDIDLLPNEIIEEIDRRLANIKICDPAIGSGAFPMGMLKELYFCRGAIENFDKSAEIKRHIIQENIYGVDIEKGAVDIARLRFWLSLIVEETTPEVLPNLDYKIMQGNSLFTTFNGKYINISDNQQHKYAYKIRQKKAELCALQKRFFAQAGDSKMKTSIDIKINILDIIALQLGYELEAWAADSATQGILFQDMQNEAISMQQIKDAITGEKKTIIQLGERLRKKLTDESISLAERSKTDLHFFDWKVMYSDIFEQGGFDIVIGNPPYGAKLSEDDKSVVRKFYQTTKTIKDVQKGSMDTYTMFIELAYWLLKKDAFMAYIVPISLTSSDSLSGVHKLLFEKCRGIKISSYSVRPQPVFKNAVVNTSILMFQKTLSPCQQLLSTKMYRKGSDFNLQQLIDNLQFTDVLKHLKLSGRIPKIGLDSEKVILDKIWSFPPLSSKQVTDGSPIWYRTTGGRYFKIVTNYSTGSTKEKAIYFQRGLANAIGCILSSNLSFWYYQIISNNLDWKSEELLSFTIPNLKENDIEVLNSLYDEYLKDVEANANVRTSSSKSRYNVDHFKEYKIVKSKAIIDRIDDYICPLYGLTPQECDFVKNYELEFRMSGDD